MTTIELRFAPRRLCLAPSRGTAEDLAEWPPSPLRFLRALLDAWRRACPDLPAGDVRELVAALASHPPAYHLPPALLTRAALHGGFVSTATAGRCRLCWDSVELTGLQTLALTSLLRAIGPLLQPESWIEAAPGGGPPARATVCAPAGPASPPGTCIRFACPVPEREYHGPTPWLDALAGAEPPLRMLPYVFSEAAFPTGPPGVPLAKPSGVSAVLFSLESSALPLAIHTIGIAEQVRTRLMGIHKRVAGGEAAVSLRFAGKSEGGGKAVGHRHVFILPLADPAGRIDRILLRLRDASEPFTRDELRAILRLRELRQPSGQPLRCAARWRGAIAPGESPFRLAARAVSATPFSPARHWRKGRGDPCDFARDEVIRECRNHGLPDPVAVRPVLRPPAGPFVWSDFIRTRKGDPPRAGFGFDIEFPEPVIVPFSIGYGCHFGLGQFDASP